jgi:hypothetical protein
MSSQTSAAYRGYSLDVQVEANNVVSLSGRELRYSVSWSVISPVRGTTPTERFLERLEFLTRDEAYSYGERRARTFVDGCMAAPHDT